MSNYKAKSIKDNILIKTNSNASTIFNWKRTTLNDCLEFNKWHNPEKEEYIEAESFKDGITKFITGKNLYLGDYVKEIVTDINKPEKEDINYCRSRTAFFNGERVGVVILSAHKIDNGINKNKLEMNLEIIAVNPNLQGRGYGTALIFDLVKNREKIFGCKPNQIVAYVEKKNTISQKAFFNNNFKTDKNYDCKKFDKLQLKINEK